MPRVKFSPYTAVSIITFFLIAAFSQAAPIQSLRSGGSFSGTDGSCAFYKAGDPNWLFQRFTYLMGYAECPEKVGEWRTKSPGCRIVLYTSGTDISAYKNYAPSAAFSGTMKATYIRDRMVQLGDIEENAYLHFYNDTKIRNTNGTADTVLIKGTYSMTITAKDSVSRVPNSYVSYLFGSRNTYSGATRLAPNFANAKLRQAYKEHIVRAFTAPAQSIWPELAGNNWDGVFFDNYSPVGLQGTGLVSGGLVVESGTAPANLLAFNTGTYATWAWNWMKIFGKSLRDTLKTSTTWSADHKRKLLAYNVGISFDASYLNPDSCGADALSFEFGFYPQYSNNLSFYRLENLFTRDSTAAHNGMSFFWCTRTPTTDGVSSDTKRNVLYANLCFYYCARSDSTWLSLRPEPGNAYGVFLNAGFDTLAWIGAMEYDLGNPTGHYQLFASGSSPDESGAQYKVWERDYQNGKVFIRARDGFNAKWGANSTPVTVNLNGSYRQLMPDGSLGAAVSTISIAGVRGAIMIPATSGGCTTPPTVPNLLSPANGTVAASTAPSLCLTNSTQSGCPQSIRYDFQISVSNTFATIKSENVNVSEGTGTTCWTTSTILSYNTPYYWRVRAGNGTNWSAWSTVWSFTTPGFPNSPPTTPNPTSPTNGASVSTLTPTLSIQNSSDPDGSTPSYHFQVGSSSSFSTIVSENTLVVSGTNGGTNWTVPTPLTNLTTYYWRARAYDGSAYSSWSTTFSFAVNQSGTNVAPTTPALNSPTNNASLTDLTPDLKINNSTDANGDVITYQFEVRDSTATTLISSASSVTSGSGTTTWTVPTSLANNTKFSWRVRAYDSKVYSGWMTTSYFRTAAPVNVAPTLPAALTPIDGDTVVGTFHILAIENSTDANNDPLKYDFRVFSDSLLASQVELGSQVPEQEPYTVYATTGSYINGKPYWWRCRAYDGTVWTNWTPPEQFWHFDVLLDAQDLPTLLSPLNGSREISTKPTFRIGWSGNRNPSACFFELALDDSFNSVIDGGTVVGKGGSAQWTVNRELENGKTYYWRARRENGGFTDAASFSVVSPIFVSPNPFSYLDGELTVHNLPAGSRFEVYTTSGEKVVQFDNLTGNFSWNVRNDSGEKLGSGVYLYYVTAAGRSVKDKFIVVR